MISNKLRAVENWLVAATSETSMPTSGTLTSSFTDTGLNDGQLGIVADSIYGTVALNTFTDATPTVAESPVIAIYQGNSASAALTSASATYPLWVRPFERSNPIDGRGFVQVTKQAFRTPSHSIWVVGDETGTAGEINVEDETIYGIHVAFRGRRVEEMQSEQQAAGLPISVTSPNFTDLGKTEAEGRSWLVHNLAYEICRNSSAFGNGSSRFPGNSPVIAFAIDTTGAAGTAQGITGGGTGLAANDVIDVLEDNVTGLTYSITLTAAQAAAINAATVSADGVAIGSTNWSIVPIDKSAAYTEVCDVIMIMALDETQAFVDYIPQLKVRLNVGLPYGFDTDTVDLDEHSYADPGEGSGRELDLLYKATQGQRKYNLRHTLDPVVEFPSPVSTSGSYNVYNIMHGSNRQYSLHGSGYVPFREIVLIPSANTTLVTAFDTAINAFLASSMHNSAIKVL